MRHGHGTLLNVMVWTLVLCAAFPLRADAYIDPGSGALLWQAALAAFAGVAFTLRNAIGRTLARLRKTPARPAVPGEDSSHP